MMSDEFVAGEVKDFTLPILFFYRFLMFLHRISIKALMAQAVIHP